MWICKPFGHKYHQFTDGMRAVFCERCGKSVKPVIVNPAKSDKELLQEAIADTQKIYESSP